MEYAVQLFERGREGNASSTPLVCYASTMVSVNGIFQDDNLLDYTFPLFIFQVMIILLTNRITAAILRPLRQPRYISEILGGFILGPTVMGRIPNFATTVFPYRSLVVLESMSYLGLVFFIFIVGIEIEIDVVRRVGRRSVLVTAACLIGPAIIGTIAGITLHGRLQAGTDRGSFVTFLCCVFSVTAFSVLARILGELKLVASDVGRLALSSSMITDGVAWVLLVYSIALSQSRGNAASAFWAVMSGGVFSVFVFAVVRPASRWVMKRTPEGEEVAELYVCVMLVGAMVAALMADVIGTHAIFGAFVYGLAVPNGPLGELLIEKIGDFIEGLLLPLFFAISGFRTNLQNIVDYGAAGILLLVVTAAAATKVAGGVAAAFYMDLPLHDGISLGLLMNTKGLVELIILNIGWDKKVLREQTFAILVVLSVVVTALVSPLVNVIAKPSRRFVPYKRRTIRWWNPDSELRILVCLHASTEAHSLISFLDLSHPTKRSPFFVFSLYLVELAGRSSTLIVVNTSAAAVGAAAAGRSRHQTESDHITHAFETYEQHAGGVSVQCITAFSPFSTMHEDVISVAEDKHCALVLLPFHKHQTVDGTMAVTHPAIRSLNQNVLDGASCSVGILVDRGLAGSRHRVALLFIGGSDDREALAFVTRLATHPSVALTVVRFLPCDAGGSPEDEDCVAQFQAETGREVEFLERMVSNAEETVAVLREMEGKYDLYVVGRGEGDSSPLTVGLTEWSECPELGAIGDLLASPDFGSTASVLVLQQGKSREGSPTEVDGSSVVLPMPWSPVKRVPAPAPPPYFGGDQRERGADRGIRA